MIKWGWIQYISVLVLFWYIMDRIQRFIFQNQLVSTIIQRPYHMKKLWDDASKCDTVWCLCDVTIVSNERSSFAFAVYTSTMCSANNIMQGLTMMFKLTTNWPLLLWPPYGIGQAIIFSCCGFYLSSIFFSSPNLNGRRLDVYHTSKHGVALVRI